jgi:hypothetical protein
MAASVPKCLSLEGVYGTCILSSSCSSRFEVRVDVWLGQLFVFFKRRNPF